MAETLRILQAATALSQALSAAGARHAFHGSLLIALLSNNPQCNEVFCIVEGGAVHPFGRVRQAIDGHPSLMVTNSPWTNRLFVTYNEPIPPITVEILPAGEGGPRRLDESTTTRIRGLPFLTVSEFLRAKINVWALRGLDIDVQDIIWVLAHYWQSVDINRIPEQDMERFVIQYPSAAVAWTAIKDRFSA
ncbi:uncharacterized protein FOMMEDRAFT_118610 [Fomitiporia mediterranea MF3/22]|uniref:uncharacterized protein n=1 Tax=Fomitiporia mediterranea (strain MF3/22) TaxID=694068 RepID=UPI0004407DF7|nr:uncharacterized protein FOMMEDRAFT_118610 [Fomitiporia mediterranea MF3/22]EJD05507.1 hypothetical protein FOMMEDRAFT_118610 [Fomitiporia mediterranea MF3/22]